MLEAHPKEFVLVFYFILEYTGRGKRSVVFYARYFSVLSFTLGTNKTDNTESGSKSCIKMSCMS